MLSATVQGYKVEVDTRHIGTTLNCYVVRVEPEDRHSAEHYASIRFLPNECEEQTIRDGLAESYPQFPANKRNQVFSNIVQLMLQLKQ